MWDCGSFCAMPFDVVAGRDGAVGVEPPAHDAAAGGVGVLEDGLEGGEVGVRDVVREVDPGDVQPAREVADRPGPASDVEPPELDPEPEEPDAEPDPDPEPPPGPGPASTRLDPLLPGEPPLPEPPGTEPLDAPEPAGLPGPDPELPCPPELDPAPESSSVPPESLLPQELTANATAARPRRRGCVTCTRFTSETVRATRVGHRRRQKAVAQDGPRGSRFTRGAARDGFRPSLARRFATGTLHPFRQRSGGMRAEKRARGMPGFFDPTCAAQRKDPLRGAFWLEVAARKGRSVFVEQREGSLRIPAFDCEIGVAKEANVLASMVVGAEAGNAPCAGTALQTGAGATGAKVSRRVGAGTVIEAGAGIDAEIACGAGTGVKVGAVTEVAVRSPVSCAPRFIASMAVSSAPCVPFEIVPGACVDDFDEGGVP